MNHPTILFVKMFISLKVSSFIHILHSRICSFNGCVLATRTTNISGCDFGWLKIVTVFLYCTRAKNSWMTL